MSIPDNQNDNNQWPPDRFAARQARREARRERRAGRWGAGWIGGLVLIALGVIFLFQNLTNLNLGNWWALFILIPAVAAFGNAWRAYQQADGHLNAPARGSLIGGIILTMITAILFFGLDWGILGPVLIILVGLGVLLNTTLP